MMVIVSVEPVPILFNVGSVHHDQVVVCFDPIDDEVIDDSAGFLKNSENYEIINPDQVGVPCSSIVLTARSGRAALKHRLELLGYQPTKPELDQIYQNFLVLADEKKKVENEDLIALVGQMAVFTK